MEVIKEYYENLLQVSMWAADAMTSSSLTRIRRTQLMIVQHGVDCAITVLALIAGEEGIRL